MTSNDLRTKYLNFFKKKGHAIIPSASLIPENDPSVLFTTAGMHPLVPFLLGEKHPAGQRLVNYQKCLRTSDIDEVGDNHHLTFFEMLGNWSLGDLAAPDGIGGAGYWKKEAINWSWEFLTDKKWLNLDPDKFAVSIFAGDEDSPFDQESFAIWKKIGFSENKIAKLDKEENWWPASGHQLGPQGPCTEIFYWTGDKPVPEKFDLKNNYWFEIWNDVFMQYNKIDEYQFVPLKQKNVDTGMGLERTLVALNELNNVYEIDTLRPILDKIIVLSAAKTKNKAMRIIADHLRAAVFIIADGVIPSNVKQGYVLRRLLRRVIRYNKDIGFPKDSLSELVKIVIKTNKEYYPELEKNEKLIINEIEKEENKFNETLEKGLKKIAKFPVGYKITGKDTFALSATFGFPPEMTIEEAKARHLSVNEEKIMKEFKEEFQKHQKLSRTASVGMFKGGLAGQSEIIIKYHTATHLLHAALRQILGDHVEQKGSNITDERLRFDFSHSEKLTSEEIKKVEDLVNKKIKENLPVIYQEMSLVDAQKSGAIGLFANKYGDKVKVYTIKGFSKEICGGPHVVRTGELGNFKITKEEASSAGIRRIKAILQ